MQRTGGRRRVIRLTIAGVAVLVTLAAFWLVAIGVLGFRDPTEQGFAATIRNDTSRTVMLKQCDVRCDTFHEVDRLAPGRTVEVNVSDQGVTNSWVVASTSDQTLGCLALRFPHKQSGVVVNTSTMTGPPC
jgi:hypothetical protein